MRFQFFVFLAVTILLFTFEQAWAQKSCYSPFELESEQGLRIHSELMVIGLTCQKMQNGAGLYGKYNSFTRKNQYLIEEYENAMIAYFRESGADNPTKSLHHLRTGLANDISQKAIKMNVGSFCRHYGNRIDQALSMDHDTIRRWAQKQWPNQPTSKPLCQRM